MSRSKIVGGAFLVIGLASFAVVNLAEWVLPARSPGIGWRQVAASVPTLVTLGAGWILLAFGQRRIPGHRDRIARVLGGLAALLSVVLAGLSLDSSLRPPHDAVTGPDRVYRGVFEIAGLAGTAVCRCVPDATARIQLPGGFTTQVAIYDGGGAGPRRGLIIAHGNTLAGGNLATYRVLATELARRGLIVATVDFPGFGKSDDPFGRGPERVADAYDGVAVLDAAIEYLVASRNVERSNITAFGHSAGVDWAMRVARSNPRISRVAVMVAPPPPQFEGEGLDESGEYAAKRSAYFTRRYARQYRYVYGRDPPQWMRWEMTRIEERYGDDIWAVYRGADHPPIMLVLGERDEPGGHAAVLQAFGIESPRRKVLLLPRSDHYLNTAQWLGVVFYDATVARDISDGLVAWIDTSGASRVGAPPAHRDR